MRISPARVLGLLGASMPDRSRCTGPRRRPVGARKKEDVARAYVTGEAIVALCGKKWVPSRDPTHYPVCPACRELKAAGFTIP